MTAQPEKDVIDFGFSEVPRSQKQARVGEVFSSVAPSYDLMNDVMSAGIHRLWKDALMDWMAPRPTQKLVDLAGGTGDIALRFLRRGGGSAHIVDINPDMLAAGKKRRDLVAYADQLAWTQASAEDLPIEDNSVDRVTIAFGLRNVTNREAALSQAYRILKPGGRFCCLEFSHVDNPALSKFMISGRFRPCRDWGAILPKMKRPIAIWPNLSVCFRVPKRWPRLLGKPDLARFVFAACLAVLQPFIPAGSWING